MRSPSAAGVLAILGVFGACGNPPQRSSARPPLRVPLDRDRLDHASLVTRGRPLTDAEWLRWRAGGVDLGAVVDELVADPFLSDQIAPAVLFRNNLARPARNLVLGVYKLQEADIGGRRVLYLATPCKPAEVVDIVPWWDTSVRVAVCASAIRAGVWEAPRPDGTMASCNSRPMSPAIYRDSKCGCGPNLVRCALPELNDALAPAAMNELRATTAHIVRTNAPLAQLFSMNETWHESIIERFYLRGLVEGRRIADPEKLFRDAGAWPPEGKLAPRPTSEDGQHAGVLTMPHFTHHTFDPRQRMRILYEALWCAGESAPGALPEDMLALHTSDLSTVNEGWQELAARPVCTHCHARLDYGMQFFHGFRAPIQVALHYVVDGSSARRGPLYGYGIRDLRGSAMLTPLGFAELATRQPEFARCVAADVAELVFGPRTAPETIERLAASVAPTELRFRDLMRLALLELLTCDGCEVPRGLPARAHGAAARAHGEAAPALAVLLERHCTACHHDGEKIPSFEGRIDRALRARIADQVLFGRMPPTGPLPTALRRDFIAAAGVSPGGRASELLQMYADPPGALPLLVAREAVLQLAGEHARVEDLNSLENAVSGRDNLFTPNFAALTAVEAFQSCAKQAGTDRDNCVQAGLDRMWRRAADR